MERSLDGLNSEQKEVCKKEENILLIACPGSGKTKTLAHRSAYLSEKYEESDLLNVFLTYTNRAAFELQLRLSDMDVELSKNWCGTIHQFCMQFIINPYSIYHSRLTKGFRIIDEYQSEKYREELCEEKGFDRNKFNLTFEEKNDLDSAYDELLRKNREIDFNLILKLSIELLEQNNFICENVAKIIRSLNVDEYQDTNEDQYNILSLIYKEKPQILLLFVGDPNQSIYKGIGAITKTKEDLECLFGNSFRELSLEGCYRSTEKIVEYYKNFQNIKKETYSLCDKKNEKSIISYNKHINKSELSTKISEIVLSEINKGAQPEEICIIAPQWSMIFSMANELKRLQPTINFDAPNISIFKYEPTNLFFMISWILFSRNRKNSYRRRLYAKEILRIFRDNYEHYISDDFSYLDLLTIINSIDYIEENAIKTLDICINNICQKIKLIEDEKFNMDKDIFFKQVKERADKHKLSIRCDSIIRNYSEKTGVVINSIHGVKGEEYETVIAFGLLEGMVPHWENISGKSREESQSVANNLLYVLASRSKKNLYLFSENGRMTKNHYSYFPTKVLAEYRYYYDS